MSAQIFKLMIIRIFIFYKRLLWLLIQTFKKNKPVSINYLNGIKFKLSPYGQVVKLAYIHFFERSILSISLKKVDPGSNVIDVGANVGIWSICLAHKIGNSGLVYAFEPCKKTASILKTNLDINGVTSRVKVYETALGNEIGKGFLSVPEAGGDADCFVKKNGREDLRENIVSINKIDEYTKTGEINADIRLIKIDCEGSELFVLQGARELLSKNDKLVIICESNPEATQRQGYKTEELFLFLEELGFSIYTLDSKTKSVVKNRPGDTFQGNFIAAKGSTW